MSLKETPVKLAIDIFLRIKEEADREGIGSKIRTRAREIPELIESTGLIPALSFCYSKSGVDSEESKAYRLYLKAILTYLIDELKIINDNVENALQKQNSSNTLKKLYEVSAIAMPLLRPFLIQFKRLCEATWESEKGGE